MIDPATGWVEIRSVPEARADQVADQVDHQIDLDNESPWERILSSTMFCGAQYYAVYTVTTGIWQGCDNQEANWQLIKQRKHALINKGNQKENRPRQSHVYHTRDKVLLKYSWKTKFNQDAYIGPYTVTEVLNNRTLRARRGNVTDTYNLRNITSFKDKD